MHDTDKTTDTFFSRPGLGERLGSLGGELGLGGFIAILILCAVLAVALVISPKILIAIILAGVVIGLTTASPYAGLLVLLAFTFLRPAERVPALESLHLVRLQALLLIAVWLILRHLRAREGLVSHPIIKVFIVGAVIIGVSALTAMWKQPAFTLWADHLFSLLILVITVDLLNSESRLRGYIAVLLAVAVFLSIEQLLRYSEFSAIAGVVRARGVGTALGDSNDFALAMLFFLPFAIYMASFAPSRWSRLVGIAVAVLLVVSIVASGSRGAVVGFVVLSAAVWFKSERKLFVGAGIFVCLVIIWVLASASYRERVTSILSYQQEETATVRRDAWKEGFRMFTRRPAFGVGPKNFPVAYYGSPVYSTTGQWRAAHSLYFEALSELGATGFIWLLVLIGLIIAAARRSQYRLRQARHPPGTAWAAAYGVELSLYGYLSAGAFLSCLYYPYLWLLGGIAIVIDIATRQLTAEPADKDTGEARDYPAAPLLEERTEPAEKALSD